MCVCVYIHVQAHNYIGQCFVTTTEIPKRSYFIKEKVYFLWHFGRLTVQGCGLASINRTSNEVGGWRWHNVYAGISTW